MVLAGGLPTFPWRLVARNCARALLLLTVCAGLRALWPRGLRAPPRTTPSARRVRPHSEPCIEPFTLNALHTEFQLLSNFESELPSFPLSYWHKHRKDDNKFSDTRDCAPFPSVLEIISSNTYWQTLRSSQGLFLLYGAYLDVRNGSRLGPAVRLLALHDRIQRTVNTHCQLWFEEHPDPVIVDVVEYTPVWNSHWSKHREGEHEPYLLACALPADVRALRPAAVSLVEKPCDRATNCLRVHFDEPPDRKQKEFAVCVKGLDFLHEDLSVRLVEWIELVRLLGADKVFFYELQVHPNISKVLAYYRARGIVESTPIALPGRYNQPAGWAVRLQRKYVKKKTMHERQMELVPYNDCLYRHMYQYRWLALLDVDEVIVPMLDPDWSALLKRVMPLAARWSWRPPRSSYHVSNVYFLARPQRRRGRAPGHLHMLQHVYRTRNFTEPGQYVKAFHETGRVVALHNHLPRACLGGPCLTYAIDPELARLQHYRADCAPAQRAACSALRADAVRDAALWRWADRLVPRVTHALASLGLLPSEPEAAT